MRHGKVFLILLLFLSFVSGCKQAEDFTETEIVEVDERRPASFIPFSDTAIYLDGTAGTDPAMGLDAVDLMGGQAISFYSFSFWFKTDAESPLGTFLKMDDSSEIEFDLSWLPGTKTLQFNSLLGSGGGPTNFSLQVEVENLKNWNHIVITYSYDDTDPFLTLNTLRMYHNGKLSQERVEQSDQVYWTLTRKLEIFSDVNKLNQTYVDEMAFWRKELSLNEVTSLYGGGAPGDLATTHSDVDAWWRLGESGPFPTLDDEIGLRKFTVLGGVALSNDVAQPLEKDPFEGDDPTDPLNDDESGGGTTGGGGSDPLEGGSGGFGGELGEGGSSGNFP